MGLLKQSETENKQLSTKLKGSEEEKLMLDTKQKNLDFTYKNQINNLSKELDQTNQEVNRLLKENSTIQRELK